MKMKRRRCLCQAVVTKIVAANKKAMKTAAIKNLVVWIVHQQ